MAKNLTTPEGRVSFPKLADPADLSGKYEINLLFPKGEAITVLNDAIKAAIEKKWGSKPPKNLHFPVKDGDEMSYAGHESCHVATFRSKDKPPLVGTEKVNGAYLAIEPREVYGGCYARVSFSAYGYDFNGKLGVALDLKAVQKIRDGDAFGAAPADVNVDFDDLIGIAGDDTDYLS